MKKKNLLILDIDDTLTCSEDKHTDALLYAMKHFKIENIDTDWRNYKNATDSYIFSVNYEKTHNKKFTFDLIEEFEQVMTKRFLEFPDTSEIKGAKKMVDYIMNETDYGVCFATGSIHKPGLLKLEQAGINFETAVLSSSNSIFTRENIVKSSIEKAKKHYQVNEFEHIISCGDGLWDVITAQNLGVHFIGVNDKNLSDFKKMNVQYHISDWTEFDLQKAEKTLKIR